MRPTIAQLADFRANRPVPGVAFALADYVNLIDGDSAGDSGAVASLEEIGTDPIYLVKLDSGTNVLVAESRLQHAGES